MKSLTFFIVTLSLALLSSVTSFAQKRDTIYVDQVEYHFDTLWNEVSSPTSHRLSFHLIAGGSFSWMNLSHKYKSVETGIAGARLGGRVELKIAKRWSALSGLDFGYELTRKRNDDIYGLVGNVLSNYKASQFSYEDIRTIQLIDNANNRHHSVFHIPVYIQYQLIKNVAITGGAELSLVDPFVDERKINEKLSPWNEDPKIGKEYVSLRFGATYQWRRWSADAVYQLGVTPLFQYAFSTSTSTSSGTLMQNSTQLSFRYRLK